MIKIARLPKQTTAVADLDSSDERLSRVPPRDTGTRDRRQQAGRPWEHRRGGDEDASQVPDPRDGAALSPGLALDGTGRGRQRQQQGGLERHDGARGHRRERRRSRHRLHRPGSRRRGRRGRAQRRRDDHPRRLRRRGRVSDGGRDRRARRVRPASISSSRTTRSSGSTTRARWTSTNLAIGLDKLAAPAAGGPAGAGVGVAILDSGIATTSDLERAAGSSGGRTSSTSGRRRMTTPATAPSSPA